MSKYRLHTAAIHAGEKIDPYTKASAPNIALSNSFALEEASGFSIDAYGDEKPYVYTRWDNPTVRMLEEKLAVLENSEECVCFASGMAATAATLQSVLKQGDHLIVVDVHYGGTAELIRSLAKTSGIETTLVDATDLDMVNSAIRPGETKLIWLETPSNPLLQITDLKAVCALAKQHGILVAVDSTVATPVATRPIDFGADFVLHSLSKYIGGHGDAIGGAVLGTAEGIREIRDHHRVHFGGVLSPFTAWVIARGAATLPIRMEYHSNSALKIAEYLQSHPRVLQVHFPGLASNPGHELAKVQMNCWGGLMSFSVKNGKQLAQLMPKEVEVIHYAVSLGSHRSLIFWMDTDVMLQSSYILPPDLEQRYRDKTNDGLFRFAVGLEDPEDLIDELDRVLAL